MEFWDYLRIIRRRWWIIVLLTVATIITVYVAGGIVKPRYVASTTFMVAGRTIPQSLLPETYPPQQVRQISLAVASRLLQSRSVFEDVIRQVNLNYDPDELQRLIGVAAIPNTDILELRVTDTDSERAVNIATTLFKIFTDFYQNITLREATSSREYIEGQLEQAKRNLAQAEDELKRYKETKGIISISAHTSSLLGKLNEFLLQRDGAEVGLKEMEARLEKVKGELANQEKTEKPTTLFIDSPMIQRLKAELMEAETRLATLLQSYTEQHPDVINQRSRIALIKENLTQEMNNLAEELKKRHVANPAYLELLNNIIRLEVEIIATQARRQAVEVIVKRLNAQIEKLPAEEKEFARLSRNLSLAENTYATFLQKYNEARIRENETMATSTVKVIDPVKLRRSRYIPRVIQLGAAGFMSILLGIIIVFSLEYIDTSLKTVEEAKAALGLPILAIIPNMDGKAIRRELKRKIGDSTKGTKHKEKKEEDKKEGVAKLS